MTSRCKLVRASEQQQGPGPGCRGPEHRCHHGGARGSGQRTGDQVFGDTAQMWSGDEEGCPGIRGHGAGERPCRSVWGLCSGHESGRQVEAWGVGVEPCVLRRRCRCLATADRL